MNLDFKIIEDGGMRDLLIKYNQPGSAIHELPDRAAFLGGIWRGKFHR